MSHTMRVLRQSGIIGRSAVWSALVATLVHVAMLSLHVTASFERAMAAPGDVANLGIHPLCGPGLSTSLTEDDTGPPAEPGKSVSSCPICTGAAPTACLSAPDSVVAAVVFNVVAASPLPVIAGPSARLQHTAGSIRGPPTLA